MRVALVALPLLFLATPAAAQQAGPAQQPRIPPELSDPRMAERLGQMTQVLGWALMNLPVGELEAIAEGRQPTAADRRRTVRESGRRQDPNFERNVQEQLAQARPMMEASMKALSAALPAMMQGLEQAGEALDRATANMPSPSYPRR